MKIDQLKKCAYVRTQLQPLPIRLDQFGHLLPSIDEDWIIQPFMDDGILGLSSVETGYIAKLGYDAVHHFTSNPNRFQGTVRFGFLTLTVQIYMQGCNLWYLPTLRPGEPLPLEHLNNRRGVTSWSA